MKTRSYFVVFVYIFAANIPFWIASHLIGLVLKGLVNDEFVLIGILSVFVRRRLTVGLLLIAIMLDMFNSIAATYLLSPSDMLRSARSLFEFAPAHLWDMVVIAICIATVCLLAALVSSSDLAGRERGCVASTLAVFILLCIMIDIGTGHIRVFRPDRMLGSVSLSRSPVRWLVVSELQQEPFRNAISAGRKDFGARSVNEGRWTRRDLSVATNEYDAPQHGFDFGRIMG
jgi:hypothetical protein